MKLKVIQTDSYTFVVEYLFTNPVDSAPPLLQEMIAQGLYTLCLCRHFEI